MAEWIEAMEADGLAPKTINNTLGTLVVCLNDAVEDGLIAANPALRVRRLPPGTSSASTCDCTRSPSTWTRARPSTDHWRSC